MRTRPIPIPALKCVLFILILGAIAFGVGRLARGDGESSVNTYPIRDGLPDPTFELFAGQYATGAVNSLVNGPGGTVYVGGYLISISGVPVANIARLNPDGSVDRSFDVGSGPNYAVSRIVLQQDGKVLISGGFGSVNGVARNAIARLNPNGSLDTSFPSISSNASQSRLDVCGLEPDGDIYVCGDFTILNGIARSGMARLSSSGVVDQTFSIGSGFLPLAGPVFAMAPLDGGKLLIGGGFYSINGIAINGLARLNQDGSVDQGFILDQTLTIGNPIRSIQLLSEGRILISGYVGIAQVFSDGSRDPSFSIAPRFSSSGIAFALRQSSGKIVVGGGFDQVVVGNFTYTRRRLARLNADGTFDSSFQSPFPQTPNAEAPNIYAGVVSQDDRIIAGGITSTSSDRTLFRVNSDGSIDNAFLGHALVRGVVVTSLLEPDGKIMVGGIFHFLGSTPRRFLGRLNADGTVDLAFDPGTAFGEIVRSVVRQPDGKYLVGTGVSINGPGPAVFRLLSNGSVDPTFTPPVLGTSTSVTAIALQSDGSILIGGNFTSVNGSQRPGFARLNADGSLDSLSLPITVLSGGIVDIVVQTTGKIIIGGSFYGPSGSGINHVARINVDGSLDPTFSSNIAGNFSGNVSSVSQIGDDLYVGDTLMRNGGGSKSPPVKLDQDGRVDPSFSSSFAQVYRVAPLNNGKLLVGGFFRGSGGASRYSIARIMANGGLDYTFDAGPVSAGAGTIEYFYEVFALSDDQVFAVGYFDSVGGQPRLSMVRLNVNLPVTRTNFDFDGDASANLGVYQSSTGLWRILGGPAGFYERTLGAPGDRLVPGDYDGDGATDSAIFRPAEGKWFVFQSSNGVTTIFTLGSAEDFATPGDFDGDGKTDFGVFKPSTGLWTIALSSGGTVNATFGRAGDLPVVGDYDGDRRADIGVFRPSTATWYLRRSTAGDFVLQFGNSSDQTVQADYDGDGLTDLGMFSRADAAWRRYFIGSQTSDTVAFGTASDIPVAGDYDGDGRADLGVFRPSSARWYVQRTTQGYYEFLWGSPGNIPIPSAFVYSAGLEGDIAARPFGDGLVQTNDVVQARRFVTGLDTVTPGMNEFQRADTAPRAGFGDGSLTAADIVQARRYAAGLDPITDASGPIGSSLITLRHGGSGYNVPFSDPFTTEKQSASKIYAAPLRKVGRDQFSLPIELFSNECPTALRFTLDYDKTHLSNPRIYMGEEVATETVLTYNTSQTGLVGVLLDSSGPLFPCITGKPGPEIVKVVVTITFDASSRYQGDLAALRFSDRISEISLSNASAVDLSIQSEDK